MCSWLCICCILAVDSKTAARTAPKLILERATRTHLSKYEMLALSKLAKKLEAPLLGGIKLSEAKDQNGNKNTKLFHLKLRSCEVEWA